MTQACSILFPAECPHETTVETRPAGTRPPRAAEGAFLMAGNRAPAKSSPGHPWSQQRRAFLTGCRVPGGVQCWISCPAAPTREPESFVSSASSGGLMGLSGMFDGQGQALPSRVAKKGLELTEKGLNPQEGICTNKKGFEHTRRDLHLQEGFEHTRFLTYKKGFEPTGRSLKLQEGI